MLPTEALVFDWNAVTAVATGLSALTIAVTVIVAVHQLGITGRQLDQYRKSTQVEVAMKILDDIQSPTYVRARRFVASELPQKLQDPTFRREVSLGLIWTKNPDEIHEEVFILRTFETIGSMVRYGLVDQRAVLDSVAIVVIASWEHLAQVIEMQRESIHPRMWENFEHLHRLSRDWFVDRGGQDRLDAWIIAVRESPQQLS
ncbi:MAG TPA: hypothetical protein VEJ20_08760 [Candidatus Eremiobacteraceae bacterium]|nr:hypothetical protein [Candidatus Eremiobacteraceae bacterium]